MINRKNVIKGLETCINRVPGEYSCTECPYETYGNDCEIHLAKDALVMLKEQEPKQIIRKQGKHENSDGSIDYFAEWYCPHCGKLLNRGFDNPWIEHCYKCGKAVTWN